MAFSVSVQKSAQEGTFTAGQARTVTVENVNKIEEAVAATTTDFEIQAAIDVSALKVFVMVCDQAVTVETNNASTPQETFNLVANKPVIFEDGDAAIFAGDVTKFFVTNAGANAATFKAIIGVDAS